MRTQDKIGFLGGGRMAEALIKGIIEAGLVVGSNILAVDPAEERRKLLSETYGVITAAEPEGLASCSIVILAVKPQVMADLLSSKRQCFNDNQLVISIAAGISLEVLESSLAGCECRVVRVMPNTPALVLEGASALCRGSLATDDDMEKAVAIFDAVGTSVFSVKRKWML